MVDNLDNGQLNIKLDMILDNLDRMSKNMVTKDVFDVWKEGNATRIARLEKDLGDWIAESTAAHVRLDAESRARHEKTVSDSEAMRVYVDNRFDAEQQEREAISEKQKDRKNAMAGVLIGVIVAGALGAASLIVQIIGTVVR
jgi:hypothetical protein